MSQLAATSEVRAFVGELRRQQVMDVVRGATFIGTLLLAWVSLRPFVDLGNPELNDPTTGNETLTYLVFGGVAVLTIGLSMRDNMRGLLTLLTPAHLLFTGWIVATIVLSLDPATSIKRFALTACVIAVASTLPLLPKTQSELVRWFSIAALVLLATCYLGYCWRLTCRFTGESNAGSRSCRRLARLMEYQAAAPTAPCCSSASISFDRAHGCRVSPIIGLSSLFLLILRRQKLARAVFPGAGFDLSDDGRSFVLASRGDAADTAGAAQHAQRSAP